MFSLRGRVGVRDLRRARIRLVLVFLGSLVALVASWVALIALNEIYGWTLITSEWSLLALSPLGFFLTSYVTMMVRRLHDHGRSGWWLLLMPGTLIFPVVLGRLAYEAREIEYLPFALFFGGLVLMIQTLSLGMVYLNHTAGMPEPNRLGPPLHEVLRTHNGAGQEIWFRRLFWYPVHRKGWALMTIAILIVLPIFFTAFWLTSITGQPWAFIPFGVFALFVLPMNVFVWARSG